MVIDKWVKAKIVDCSNPKLYWYYNMLGKTVWVKKWSEASWGVEERRTGNQIADRDFEVINS